MELVAFLQVLRRHRILVVLGALLAIGIALTMAMGKPSRFGVASARVVLDTKESQLLNADTPGADTLVFRAAMLADMVTGPPWTTGIARDMRIPADQLLVVAPHLTVPETATPLTDLASEAAAETPEPYVVSVRFEDALPIISIDSRAPDRAGAARLAQAAARALQAAAVAPPGAVDPHHLVAETIAPAKAKEVISGRRRTAAVAVSAVLFGLWCIGLGLGSGLMRAWRGTGRPRPAGINAA
jgi:hypothetical protein